LIAEKSNRAHLAGKEILMGWPTDPEEYDGERMFGYGPESELPESKPAPEVSPEQKLLDWLQRWNKPALSLRDILIHGPRALRDRETAISAAQVLTKNGWLQPVKSLRHDAHQWEIIRRPIVHPVATTVATTVAT
jgi:hypothetical protein